MYSMQKCMEIDLDWDNLRVFLAIAREGSLSGAARVLQTTQPTLGRKLAQMEKDMGARLLERHPKGYTLTNLGEAVIANAERIEAEVIATERAISGKDIALEGNVRVTSVDILSSKVLVPAIAKIQCKHPKITVELINDARMLDLTRREADIAIRFTRFKSNELIVRKLGTFRAGFYASKSYLEKFGTPNAQNSACHSIIDVLEDQSHLEEMITLRQNLPMARTAIRTNSRDNMIKAVEAGIGIGCLPKIGVTGIENIIELRLEKELSPREVWLGVHADLQRTPRIRAVIDAIAEGFKGL